MLSFSSSNSIRNLFFYEHRLCARHCVESKYVFYNKSMSAPINRLLINASSAQGSTLEVLFLVLLVCSVSTSIYICLLIYSCMGEICYHPAIMVDHTTSSTRYADCNMFICCHSMMRKVIHRGRCCTKKLMSIDIKSIMLTNT